MEQECVQQENTEVVEIQFKDERSGVCYDMAVACKCSAAHIQSNSKHAVCHSQGDKTGGRTSAAARALIWYLLQNQKQLSGKTVIELGCGNGACGIFGSRFCDAVVLTDGDEEALQLCRVSLDLMSRQKSPCSQVEIRSLRWGDETQIKQLVQAVNQNYGSNDIVIIGADLVYYKQGIEQLIKSVSGIINQSSSKCVSVISFAPRFSGWKEEIQKCVEEHELVAHIMDASIIVSQQEYSIGWYNNVRLLVIAKDAKFSDSWRMGGCELEYYKDQEPSFWDIDFLGVFQE